MPIKKRSAFVSKIIPKREVPKPTHIKKRKPMKESAVYLDGDVLVVKTPPECTRWPQDFRLRLVRDFRPNKTIMPASLYIELYADRGLQNKIHKIMGRSVRIHNVMEPVAPTHVVLLRTEVIDIAAKKAMYLYHDDPAMRILMVYSFLQDKTIAGVPQLEVYDYPLNTVKPS